MRSALPDLGAHLRSGFTHLRSGVSLGRSRGRLGVGGSPLPERGAWRRAARHLRWLTIPLLLAILLLAASWLDQHAPNQHSATTVAQRPNRGLRPTPPQTFNPRKPAQNPPEATSTPHTVQPEHFESGNEGGEATGGNTTTTPPQPHRPQTYRSLTIHHLHHLRIIWLWNWENLVLVALGICVFFLTRRQLTPRTPLVAGLIVIAALGLSALATSLAIHQVGGPGTYVVNPIVVADEHENSEGDLFIELEKPIDHYHPPLEADVALLLLAAGLTEPSVPAGRTLVRELRDRAKQRREAARAKSATVPARHPRV